ncbi:hypothetical protein B0H14DRAFT_3531448 [Mycena olivaceomarginata]|nr:hypothetical protein B0H14DRAFT_3531448 [Mycena olivaceomarginata]
MCERYHDHGDDNEPPSPVESPPPFTDAWACAAAPFKAWVPASTGQNRRLHWPNYRPPLLVREPHRPLCRSQRLRLPEPHLRLLVRELHPPPVSVSTAQVTRAPPQPRISVVSSKRHPGEVDDGGDTLWGIEGFCFCLRIGTMWWIIFTQTTSFGAFAAESRAPSFGRLRDK